MNRETAGSVSSEPLTEMEENHYSILLYNDHFFREIEIPPDTDCLRIGTEEGNAVRLRRELFFEPFRLELIREGPGYALKCFGNVYFSKAGDVSKLYYLKLTHGTEACLRYQQSNNEALQLAYSINFDYRVRHYGFEIRIPPGSSFTIGASESDSIQLFSTHIRHDRLEILAEDGLLHVLVCHTDFGLLHNGVRRKDSRITARAGDFFALAEYSFYYDGYSLRTDRNRGIRVRGLTFFDHVDHHFLRYPCFQRNTRVKTVPETTPVEILDPPERPEKPKDQFLMSVMPAVLMLTMMFAVRSLLGITGGAFILFSACSAAAGLISGMVSFFRSRKEFRKALLDRERIYRRYIEDKRKFLAAEREKEKAVLEYRYGNIRALLNKAKTFSGDLFDRIRNDDDFLSVRLGSGTIVSARPVRIREQERMVVDDELLLLPRKVRREYRFLENAPVVLRLKEAGAVGLVGQASAAEGMIRSMVLDLAIRQHFEDLKMFFVLGGEQKERYRWLRFLPHLQSEGQTARNIACGGRRVTVLFEELYRELSRREDSRSGEQYPHMILFVLDRSEFLRHPVSRFTAGSALLQATFIFLAPERDLLPLGCTRILHVGPDSGTLVNTADDRKTQAFTYAPVSETDAEEAALRLSPVYSEEIRLEDGLAKSISLFSVLGIRRIGDLDLERRWAASDVCRSMEAPLGMKGKKTVSLDIHERAHGPHGLVAGTTGSGKSEILRTYVLSMAARYHPYDVGFLIIDFKGGGMAHQLEKLPHLMGTITNIDGKQIGRSLRSMRAELMKRQTLFAEAGVNHIDDYIRKYKTQEVPVPLPHLIVIVDEFAELKSAHPDFMKELISAARIGRSLGVHLILATQKPSGQVSEQIWSNSRFRICLRVQSAEDSREMLKSPLASEITEPGRAYLQVGNNEIFELFQSAYSGEEEQELQNVFRQDSYVLQKVSFEGWREVICENKPEKTAGVSRTQLEAVTACISRYCRDSRIGRLDPVCPPPLEEKVLFPEEPEKRSGSGTAVEIALADDPEHQQKFRVTIDPGRENVLVIGSPRSGKTNFLQTVIRGLCASYSPAEVNIYILDFGSMALTGFAGLPHVGGVAAGLEEEKIRNLFRLLREEIRSRKQKMSAAGVSSLAAWREAGRRGLPQIVLMIDNYAALREMYLTEEDVLLPVCRDGLPLGISVILCSQQASGLSYRYLACFAGRIALFCNEAAEYTSLLSRCRTYPDPVPGRGIMEIDREVYEIQIFLSFPGEEEGRQTDCIREYIALIREKYPDVSAEEIPWIPDIVTEGYLDEKYGAGKPEEGRLALGLSHEDVSLRTLDLTDMGVIAMAGCEGDKKTAALGSILNWLCRHEETFPAEVYLADDRGRSLSVFRELGIVREYTTEADAAAGFIEKAWHAASERWEQTAEGRTDNLCAVPLILTVIQNQEVTERISRNSGLLKKYRELTGQFRKMKTGILFCGIENTAYASQSPEVLRIIRESGTIWFFDDLKNLRLLEVPVRLQRRYGKDMLPGDFWQVKGRDFEKVRMVYRTEKNQKGRTR